MMQDVRTRQAKLMQDTKEKLRKTTQKRIRKEIELRRQIAAMERAAAAAGQQTTMGTIAAGSAASSAATSSAAAGTAGGTAAAGSATAGTATAAGGVGLGPLLIAVLVVILAIILFFLIMAFMTNILYTMIDGEGPDFDNITNIGYIDWAIDIANNHDADVGYSTGGCGIGPRCYIYNGGSDHCVDCSSFVYYSLLFGGYKDDLAAIGYTEQSWPPATGGMGAYLSQIGFENVGTSNSLSANDLRPGDILVNTVHHTAMYIGNGQIVHASSDRDGRPGDSSGTEVYVRDYYVYSRGGWDQIWRNPHPIPTSSLSGDGNKGGDYGDPVPVSSTTNIENSAAYQKVQAQATWTGQRMTRATGRIEVGQGVNGSGETYYNMNMSGVVKIMRGLGFSEQEYPYWVRSDGVKMLGNYVMVAGDIPEWEAQSGLHREALYYRGQVVETTVGMALVCDCGGYLADRQNSFDIAVNW